MEIRQIVKLLKDGGMGCNCDFDRWIPEVDTGHTWVCRIHKTAEWIYKNCNADDAVMRMVKESISQYRIHRGCYLPDANLILR